MQRVSNTELPYVSREVQETLWRLADALAKNLRAPNEDQPGDPRWTVSGEASGTWMINHPDLEMLKDGNSPLIPRIKKLSSDKWSVIAQNQLQNKIINKVLAIEGGVPDRTWDIARIAQVASQWFQSQKNEISEEASQLTPDIPPGSMTDTGGDEAAGGIPSPMASRRTLLLKRRSELKTRKASETNKDLYLRLWEKLRE